MFNGKLVNVIDYCNKIGVPYSKVDMNGTELLYIYQKDAYEKRDKYPKKYANLYVSYLRLSEHEGHKDLYGRCDGLCQYYNDKEVKRIIDILKEEPAAY